MKDLAIETTAAEQTTRLGQTIGRLVEPGDVVLLEGNLGAGKTTLVQGIAQGLGVEGYASSPTFTLVNEYEGKLSLYHIDLYRLSGAEEAIDLGIDEYLYGNGVTAIEWAEKAMEAMPAEYLQVNIKYQGETQRLIEFHARGEHYEALLAQIAANKASGGV